MLLGSKIRNFCSPFRESASLFHLLVKRNRRSWRCIRLKVSGKHLTRKHFDIGDVAKIASARAREGWTIKKVHPIQFRVPGPAHRSLKRGVDFHVTARAVPAAAGDLHLDRA